MAQHGFFFHQGRCTGCHTCTVACKSHHQLPPGPVKYLRVYQYEKGSFPELEVHVQWIPCYHCEKPVCVESCPTGAIHKEEKYGAVIINQEECDGCRMCYDACPYGAPVFESDETGTKARKCDMCLDRLEQNDLPVCVMACPVRALDFGSLDYLKKTYGDRQDLEDLPESSTTEPAVVFKPRMEKRQIVPYDSRRALELFMKRDPLPPVYASLSDVTDVEGAGIGRNRLVIKHDTAADLLSRTRNDEG